VRRMATRRPPCAAGEARTRMPPTCTSTSSSSNAAKLRPCSVTWLPMYSACRASRAVSLHAGNPRRLRPQDPPAAPAGACPALPASATSGVVRGPASQLQQALPRYGGAALRRTADGKSETRCGNGTSAVRAVAADSATRQSGSCAGQSSGD
jgi:hypothetical protein